MKKKVLDRNIFDLKPWETMMDHHQI